MPPVSSTMHALNEPEPELLLPPLAVLLLLDGLLPHAVRTRAATATLLSTAPARLICTDVLPLESGSGPWGRDRRSTSAEGRDGATAGGALLIADPRCRPLRSANVS